MVTKTKSENSTANREISVTRLINAPRELVFELWTNPEHIKHWWGPNGFTNTIDHMDVKPGGEWDLVMHGPDGTDYRNKHIFKEVIKPEKLVLFHATGPKFQMTVTFEEQDDKTLLSITSLFESAEQLQEVIKVFKADEGLKQNVDRLENYATNLSVEKATIITRIFDAPRNLVWKAWTDPNQLEQWWGPNGFTNPVCNWEAKPGNTIRVDMKGPDGVVYPMDGMFHEVVEPERLVFMSAALDKDGSRLFEVLNTITFIQLDGKTKVTINAIPTRVKREAKQYLDGANEGWSQSLDRLSRNLSNGESAPLVFQRTYNAPVAMLWKALTDKEEMKKWYFDLAEFKPEVGFEFHFYGGKDGRNYLHLCKITEVVPGKKLTYSWRYDGYAGNSFVTFELFPEGDKAILKLTHAGLATFPKDQPDFAKLNFINGWTYILGMGLKAYLEKGRS